MVGEKALIEGGGVAVAGSVRLLLLSFDEVFTEDGNINEP